MAKVDVVKSVGAVSTPVSRTAAGGRRIVGGTTVPGLLVPPREELLDKFGRVAYQDGTSTPSFMVIEQELRRPRSPINVFFNCLAMTVPKARIVLATPTPPPP